MDETNPTSVERYIASQPDAVQGILKRVRTAIRKAVPRAKEMISYKMPSYKLDGADVLHFAVWKQHYSIYLASERIVAALRDELAPYKVRKGTISFPLSQPVPATLIARIAQLRAKEVEERATRSGARDGSNAERAPRRRG
jgi:uncharacterized protein YdhG (YjbR/CyaY superfamily)